MTPAQKDLSELTERIRAFLLDSGWQEGRQVRSVVFYIPPASLGIEGKFSIALPTVGLIKGEAKLLHGAAQSLLDIYGYANLGDLLNKAAATVSDISGPIRIVTRFVDTTTRTGAIPLSSIVAFVTNVESSLYQSAKFRLGTETRDSKLIAQRFAKDSLFLQTEIGSFVAKVEVPNSVLKQADLFGGELIASAEVCSALFSGIQFINENIMCSDIAFDEAEMLSDAVALFDVELLDALAKVVTGSKMDQIDFSIEIGSEVRKTTTGWLSPDRTQRLSDFCEFMREQLRGENDLDVTGAIVELRSRDPAGNRNHILLVADFHGDRTFVSATLTNEQYQRAVDAHRKKREVRLKGNGTRLKTQIRVTEIKEFLA